jgi:polysaccharide pyruvyl transferase WcaK-like protein
VKVALFGMFGVGNLGNEASLDAILRALRAHAPDAQPLAICPAPDAAARLHGVPAVATTASFAGRIARRLPLLRGVPAWRHALRALRGVRLFVVPGTGILDDFGTGPRGLPYDLFRWCAAARLRGARVVFASVGAGPIHHPWSRRLMTWAVRLAQYRSFRDAGSKAYMAGCGCDTSRDLVAPDLVFGLPVPAAAVHPRVDGPLVVGLNAMAYYGWSHDPARGQEIHRVYLEKLAAFVRWLVAEGHVVRLFIGEDRDLAACRALHERVDDDRVLPAQDAASLHELLARFAETDLVVATRFHNVVAALMLARPVLSIGYAVKNDELMADVGLGSYCQAIEELDVERLKEQFLRLRADRERIAVAIAERTRVYRAALAAQDATLFGASSGAADRDQ